MTAAERKARLAVLVSGRGRNLQAIHGACADGRIPAEVIVVISNRSDARALTYAAESGLDAVALPHSGFADREAFDAALAGTLRRYQPDIIAMAGFMRVLGTAFVSEFRGRLLNIHPSLLPRYPGLHTHRRVLQAGDAEHGATVHFVTGELDGGPRIVQGTVSVDPDDDEDRLAERVMQQVERRIYPQAVAWMARGEIGLRAGQVLWRGVPLQEPLTLDDVEKVF